MFLSCLDYKKPLIITHCGSNESISNTTFRTLIDALDLLHCTSWAPTPSIFKHKYFFPDVGSVDDLGMVVAVIVSPKE